MFVLTQTLKLDEFEGWEGCYIKFNSCSMGDLQNAGFSADGEAKDNIEKQNKFLEKFFVEGFGWNGKDKIAMKAGDLKDLPLPIYLRAVSFLVEAVKPKSTPQN